MAHVRFTERQQSLINFVISHAGKVSPAYFEYLKNPKNRKYRIMFDKTRGVV